MHPDDVRKLAAAAYRAMIREDENRAIQDLDDRVVSKEEYDELALKTPVALDTLRSLGIATVECEEDELVLVSVWEREDERWVQARRYLEHDGEELAELDVKEWK